MATILNESLGSLEYDGLINSASPADIIHASLASGYGKLQRGYLIAKDSSGNLIPWGSDITDDLVEVLDVTSHAASKSQSGLNTNYLKVYAAEFLNEAKKPNAEKKATFAVAGLDITTLAVKAKKLLSDDSLSVSSHVATKEAAGLDIETLVVKSGTDTLEEETDYTITYESDTLTITLVDGSSYYSASTLAITCDYAAYDALTADTHYTAAYTSGVLTITMIDSTDYTYTSSVQVYCEFDDDTFVLLEADEDYTATYSTPTLSIALDEDSYYYDTPRVKVVCPYTYSEASIAAGNLILAEDVDTGDTGGQTVVAKAYRTGIFNQLKLLYDAKALGGITDITKEKLRSLGILLNDSMAIS